MPQNLQITNIKLLSNLETLRFSAKIKQFLHKYQNLQITPDTVQKQKNTYHE